MGTDERVDLLQKAYGLFNRRDVDALLAMMTDDVEWPDVANAAVLHGKPAIRSYWEAQFAAADPRVTPTAFLAASDGAVVAVVEQQVFDHVGQTLAPPARVYHRYSFSGPLVRRMEAFASETDAIGSG
jgi:ketosteroid isomerase-like protein